MEVFKTANAQHFAGDPLFPVAMAPGIADSDWAETWLKVQQDLGIDGMVPPPDHEGRPTKRPVETDELGHWLKLVLD